MEAQNEIPHFFVPRKCLEKFLRLENLTPWNPKVEPHKISIKTKEKSGILRGINHGEYGYYLRNNMVFPSVAVRQ